MPLMTSNLAAVNLHADGLTSPSDEPADTTGSAAEEAVPFAAVLAAVQQETTASGLTPGGVTFELDQQATESALKQVSESEEVVVQSSLAVDGLQGGAMVQAVPGAAVHTEWASGSAMREPSPRDGTTPSRPQQASGWAAAAPGPQQIVNQNELKSVQEGSSADTGERLIAGKNSIATTNMEATAATSPEEAATKNTKAASELNPSQAAGRTKAASEVSAPPRAPSPSMAAAYPVDPMASASAPTNQHPQAEPGAIDAALFEPDPVVQADEEFGGGSTESSERSVAPSLAQSSTQDSGGGTQHNGSRLPFEEGNPAAGGIEPIMHEQAMDELAEGATDGVLDDLAAYTDMTTERTSGEVASAAAKRSMARQGATGLSPAQVVAWLRAGDRPGLHAIELPDGWSLLEMKLQEGDGAVQVKVRRETDHVAVAVGFSDPHLRAIATHQVDRLQHTLEATYETQVDLSFMNDQTSEHQSSAEQAGGARRGESAPSSEVEATSPKPSQWRHGRHEWIG